MIHAAIVGATGYTGSELVRLLTHHPEVQLEAITSESKAGQTFADIHPQYRGIMEKELIKLADLRHYDLDIVFLALPHGVSMDFVRDHAHTDFKIVDLSGDFRLTDARVYEDWYHKEHVYPAGFGQAVYGLTELNREAIKQARLVANPGCFPTGAILGAAPIPNGKKGVPQTVIVDAKTGVTGAGAHAKTNTHFPNVNDNFKAYGLRTHRHTIEIEQTLNLHFAQPITVQFTPHLLPVDRGILSTIYYSPGSVTNDEDLQTAFRNFYRSSPFVRVIDTPPEIKHVRGSNYCDIYPMYDARTGHIMVITAIDNLVKGAAGAAIQNMNLMMGLEESVGLHHNPIQP